MVSQKAKETLMRADKTLAALIEVCGDIDIPLNEAYFPSLVSSVVGQQLSGRVADVIWKRLTAFLGGAVTPENILAADAEALRGLGLSYSKISYTKNIAAAAADGSLDLDNIRSYADEDIIAQLTRIKGVGRWTAEMFLIFSLGREDVFSMGDGGLARAVKNRYGFDREPTKAELAAISAKWSPYRSAASLYLWRSLDRDIEACLKEKKL